MELKKLLYILLITTAAFFVGTAGFMYIENWAFFDALYMTIITLTTIGFGEVHALSYEGKIFTICLIFMGLGIVTFSISSLMNYMLNFDLKKHKRDKMQKKINELNKHTVVCGFGRMGEIVCKQLAASNTTFVVIENNQDIIQKLEKSGYLWIQGDAAHDETLENAGLDRAKVLVSLIDDDSDALYISLVGRSMTPDLYIICRANDEQAKKRILKAGANKVVLPTHMTALRVSESVLNPAVEDFLDLGSGNTEGSRIQLADLYISKTSHLNNSTLGERGKDMLDLIIVGVRKPDKSFIFKPASDYVFTEGDCLISMGSNESYRRARDLLKLETSIHFS